MKFIQIKQQNLKYLFVYILFKNGGLSALPYIAFWLITIVSSVVGDKLIQSNALSKTVVRKIFNSLGSIIPMGAILGLAFVTCAIPYVGVALLVIGLSFK